MDQSPAKSGQTYMKRMDGMDLNQKSTFQTPQKDLRGAFGGTPFSEKPTTSKINTSYHVNPNANFGPNNSTTYGNQPQNEEDSDLGL